MSNLLLIISLLFTSNITFAEEADIELESNSKITVTVKANTPTSIRCKGNYYSLQANDGVYDVVDQDGNKILFGVSYAVAKKELQDLNGLISTSEIKDLLKSK